MICSRNKYRILAFLLTLTIFAMAYFGRSVQKLARPILDSRSFVYLCFALFLSAAIYYYLYFFKRFGLKRLLLHVVCCAFVILLCADNLVLPIERFHLFEYALLAVLIVKIKERASLFSAALTAWIIGSCLGICDELIQAVAPGRVCDVRDMAINSASVFLGILIALPLKTRQFSQQTSSAV